MFCSSCGYQNGDAALFCTGCGARLTMSQPDASCGCNSIGNPSAGI